MLTAIHLLRSYESGEGLPRPAWFAAIVLVAAALSGGCSSGSPPQIAAGYAVAPECPSPSAADYFLGADRLGYDRDFDRLTRERISSLLRPASEMPLWCGAGIDEAYRVVWVPSYRPAAVASLVHRQGAWHAAFTSFSDPRDGGESEWRVVDSISTVVSRESAQTVADTLEKTDFWRLRTARLQDAAGNDGGRLLVEGRQGSRYQVVYHWQPQDEPLGDAARRLIEIARGVVPEGLVPRR